MGKRVNDQDRVACMFGFVDTLHKLIGVIVVKFKNIKGKKIGILGCAAAFGINDGDLTTISQRCSQLESGHRLSCTSRASQSNTSLSLVFHSFLKWHINLISEKRGHG